MLIWTCLFLFLTCANKTTGCVFVLLGAIAATVFIAFILALYAVLWKCMVSPPQRYTTDTSITFFPPTASMWFHWHSDLVNFYLFTCLLVSRVWTLYPSSWMKDKSHLTWSALSFPLHIRLCYSSCHVSTPVCVSLSENTAGWGYEYNRGTVPEDWLPGSVCSAGHFGF